MSGILPHPYAPAYRKVDIHMFTITKNARIHESVAADKFSQAERASMTKERGSNYYVWPFQCDVIGCGDSVPDNFDVNGRNRFPRDEAYDLEAYIADKRDLVEKHGLKMLVTGDNRGMDLELRARARPNPKSKMSDADKMAWVIGNVDADQWAGKTAVEFVAIFEANNG